MRKISSLLLTLLVGIGMVGFTAPAANAEPVTVTHEELVFDSRGDIQLVWVTFAGGVPEGVEYTATAYGCGNALASEKYVGRGDLGQDYGFMLPASISRHDVGPMVNYTVTFSDPSIPTYEGSILTPSNYPRTCDEGGGDTGEETGSNNLVKKWSTKVSHARHAYVGSKVKVTPTRVISGAEVTYRWKVGKKVVKKGKRRALHVKKAYRGKPIRVRVIVKKGDVTKAKTIGFGKARR